MNPSILSRAALPSELDRVVAIDDAATALYAEAGVERALSGEHPCVVDEIERAPEIAELLAHQREALPHREQRIAMVLRP